MDAKTARRRWSEPLSRTHPQLATEWHRVDNALSPDDVTAGSSYEAAWCCPECSWVWTAPVASRAAGRGCPRQRLHGDKLLAAARPDLAAEWHPGRNGELSPLDVSAGSTLKVWWLCRICGCDWQARIVDRAAGTSCRNYRQHPGYQAPGRTGPRANLPITDTHPHLVDEWHPTRNGQLSTAEVTAGSNKQVWWRCRSCSHEWATLVFSRVNGSRCPKAKLHDGNTLAASEPDLAAQWHPGRNGDLTPADVTPSSSRRVWWNCPLCGHEWQAKVGARRRGGACPQARTHESSLALSDPDLAAQRHPTRNGDLTPDRVTPKSARKVWWLCLLCGQEWKVEVYARSAGSGCPSRSAGTSDVQVAVAAELAAVFGCSFDDTVVRVPVTAGRDLLPDAVFALRRGPYAGLAVEYDGAAWHDPELFGGPNAPANDRTKTVALAEAGYAVVRLRERRRRPGTDGRFELPDLNVNLPGVSIVDIDRIAGPEQAHTAAAAALDAAKSLGLLDPLQRRRAAAYGRAGRCWAGDLATEINDRRHRARRRHEQAA